MIQDMPEYRLVVGVLMQAIEDAVWPVGSQHSQRDKQDALRWVRSDEPGLMGFAFCCAITGIEEEAIRARVERAPASVYRAMKSKQGAAA